MHQKWIYLFLDIIQNVETEIYLTFHCHVISKNVLESQSIYCIRSMLSTLIFIVLFLFSLHYHIIPNCLTNISIQSVLQVKLY